MLHPVVMAGGSGTRFWPRSRRRRPKQLIRVFGQGTMIQQTVARLEGEVPPESFLVVTTREQAPEIAAQLPELKPEQIVAEPCGRDTSACIALAAFLVRRKDPEAVMFVLSADHTISPAREFARCLKEAARIAVEHRALVAFGIRPSHPSELYGYIRRGAPLTGWSGALPAFRLAEFKEKPSRAAAEEYLRAGDYYWNSGNFVWRAADILDAFKRFMPELHAALERIEPDLGTPRQEAVLERVYPTLPKLSIDYGVMEKAPNAVLVEAQFQWDDVGAWDSIARHHPADEHGNHVLARHAGIDTRNCIVVGEEGHLLTTIGVEDLIVVQTRDATLICDRRRAGHVKMLVDMLKAQGLEAHL
jgi:mannose-1-phosphate guanylyltransferase